MTLNEGELQISVQKNLDIVLSIRIRS